MKQQNPNNQDRAGGDSSEQSDTHSQRTADKLIGHLIEQEWQNLTQDWQSQDYVKTDMQALLRRTRIRTYWAKSYMALNILATIGLVVAFFVGLYQGEWGGAINTYLAGVSIISVIFSYYEFRIRVKTWQQCCGSPDKAIEQAIDGCLSSIKYIKLTKITFLAFLLMINWLFFALEQQQNEPDRLSLILVNGTFLVLFVITHLLHLKRKKEYRELVKLNQGIDN